MCHKTWAALSEATSRASDVALPDYTWNTGRRIHPLPHYAEHSPRLHPVDVEHSQRCYLAPRFGRWLVSQAALSIFIGGAQNAVKQRECVWLVRAEGRVKSEEWRFGGGVLVSSEQPRLILAHRQHIKFLARLPNPAPLKNTILFKVYRQRPRPSLPPPRFPLPHTPCCVCCFSWWRKHNDVQNLWKMLLSCTGFEAYYSVKEHLRLRHLCSNLLRAFF